MSSLRNGLAFHNFKSVQNFDSLTPKFLNSRLPDFNGREILYDLRSLNVPVQWTICALSISRTRVRRRRCRPAPIRPIIGQFTHFAHFLGEQKRDVEETGKSLPHSKTDNGRNLGVRPIPSPFTIQLTAGGVQRGGKGTRQRKPRRPWGRVVGTADYRVGRRHAWLHQTDVALRVREHGVATALDLVLSTFTTRVCHLRLRNVRSKSLVTDILPWRITVAVLTAVPFPNREVLPCFKQHLPFTTPPIACCTAADPPRLLR